MSNDVLVKEGVVILASELDFLTSRSGGAGGQHVNKTNTKVSVRWHVASTKAISGDDLVRVLAKLAHRLTNDGYLLIHCESSRSQTQNKEKVLQMLAEVVRNALYLPKKRKATKVSAATKASRTDSKVRRSKLKKLRNKKVYEFD